MFDHLNEMSPVALLALAKQDSFERKPRTLLPVPPERIKQARRWLDASHCAYQPNGPCEGWTVIAEQRLSQPWRPAHRLYVTTDDGGDGDGGGGDRAPLVVLAIRGSQDLNDLVTNLFVETLPFHDGYGHAGMVSGGAALAKLYGPAIALLERDTGAKVVTTGHSLGAATAASCAIELRRQGYSSSAASVGFGTPAAFAPSLAQWSSGFVTSIINGDDIVPRITEASLLRLHLRSLRVDVGDVLLCGLEDTLAQWSLPASCDSAHVERAERFKASVVEFAHDRLLPTRTAAHAAAIAKRLEATREFVVPGEVLLINKQGNVGLGSCDDVKDIVLSRTLVSDHLTASYAAGLGHVLRVDAKPPSALTTSVAHAVRRVKAMVGGSGQPVDGVIL